MQGVTKASGRTIRKAGIQVHAKPHFSSEVCWFPQRQTKKVWALMCYLRSHLFQLSISALWYVDETERSLKHCITEHKKYFPPLGPTLKPRTTSSWWYSTLNPSISNVASKRRMTMQLWNQTSIRTRANIAYPRSTHPSSSHVTTGHPVGHMISFPLLFTF